MDKTKKNKLAEHRTMRSDEVEMPWGTLQRIDEYSKHLNKPVVGNKTFYGRYLLYRFMATFRIVVLLVLITIFTNVVDSVFSISEAGFVFAGLVSILISGILSEALMEFVEYFLGSPSYGRFIHLVSAFAIDLRIIYECLNTKTFHKSLCCNAFDCIDDIVFMTYQALMPISTPLNSVKISVLHALRKR